MCSRKRSLISIASLALLAGVLTFALLAYDPGNQATEPACSGELPCQALDAPAASSDSATEASSADGPAEGTTDIPENSEDTPLVEGDTKNEPDIDAQETEKRPYSASNQPKWEDIKDLPIGVPREPAAPEYASNIEDEHWRVYDSTPGLDYRDKLTRLAWDHEDEDAPRRLVHGRVFEIIGRERIPLKGVLVVGGWNRTFTNDEGRFEMLSTVWEPSDDDKKQGQEYRLEIVARAPGYVDFRGRHAYSNLDATDEGFEIYLLPRDQRLIRIRFENPQAVGGLVTVVLARNDYGNPKRPGFAIDWDEKRYILAQVDPREESWFAVPLRYYHTSNETRFALRSVSAPNILADIKTISPASETDPMDSRQETIYVVRLLVEDTVTISGTATDMQTGDPIPHARVYGPGVTEFTVADEHGSFELITSKTPRGPRGEPIPEDEQRYLHVSDERYATLTAEVKDSSLYADGTGRLMLGPGGNLSGPWTFQLRRWVEATIECTFLASESRADATLELIYDVVDDLPDDSRREVGADGFCRFPRIPWGTETLRLSTRTPFAAREVEVTPASWEGIEPYLLSTS